MDSGSAITNVIIHELNSMKVNKLWCKVNEDIMNWNIRGTDRSYKRDYFILK